jgi:O-antigen/teichoic acid export membrane protein
VVVPVTETNDKRAEEFAGATVLVQPDQTPDVEELRVEAEQNPPQDMHRGIVGLFIANIVTLVVVGLSFVAYSQLLDPSDFGLYAVALSAATILALVLDGGLKTTIIKLDSELSPQEESSIAVWMVLVSAGLLLLLVVTEGPLLAMRPGIRHDAKFVTIFVGIALLFYPFVTLPTANMERKLRYGQLAWIESLGMVVERGGPALLLILTKGGIYCFVWALLASRVLRVLVLAQFHRIDFLRLSWAGFSDSLRHLREGAWIQAGTLSAVIRDNLHTLLVGPLFGKEWIGYYAWALQICLVSSQLFAQISARVSLPLLAQAQEFDRRWPRCLFQIRLLTMLTVPVLCGMWLILPAMDTHFFHGKWEPALALIPFLFFRMIAGMATTPIGPLIIVQRGGAVFAKSNFQWTLAEAAGAFVLLKLLGPTGLGWSYAFVVWFGLWILLVSLRQKTGSLVKELVKGLVLRPSVLSALCVTAGAILVSKVSRFPISNMWPALFVAGVLVVCSYAVEPELRGYLFHGKA